MPKYEARFGEDFHKNNKASVVFFGRCSQSSIQDSWTKQRQTVVTNEEDEKTVETTILKSAYKFLADSK